MNTGKGCTGLCNSGDRNSGNHNSGNHNSGDCNIGNRNSGDWNKCSFSNGCFNTAEPKIYLFNKQSDLTYRDWLNSDARRLLNQIQGDCLKYVWFNDMTDEEKTVHPEATVTGGYLKQLDKSECGSIWWRGLNDYENPLSMQYRTLTRKSSKKSPGLMLIWNKKGGSRYERIQEL